MLCFYIIFRPVKQDEEENVELDDIVYDIKDSDDQAIDETDQEELGTGLIKIVSTDDSSLLTDDQLFLVYLQPLLDLAKTKVDGTCGMESCCSAVVTKTK